MKLREQIKILESRKELVESYLGVMNEVVQESILLEKKLFDPMNAFEDEEVGPIDYDRGIGDYWKNLNKKADNKGFLGKMARKMKGFADKASGKVIGAADKTDSAARAAGQAVSDAGKSVSNAGKDVRRGLGFVKPGEDMDDPRYASQLVSKSIKHAKKSGDEFKAKALNTTKDIDAFQSSVSAMLDKFTKLSDTLPQETRGKTERAVIGLAKQFHDLLNQEKGRIDSYLTTIKKDLADSGYGQEALNS